MSMQTPNKFLLSGGNTGFADRQKLLFDKLSIAEKECNKDKNVCVPDVAEIKISRPPLNPLKRKRSETRQFRGKESIFKRPEGPAPRKNIHNIPDYHRNPHKWTKYSLDDVSNEDMSDQSNAQTAFALINELKARKAKLLENARISNEAVERSESAMETDDTIPLDSEREANIKFRKPKFRSAERTLNVDEDEKPVFRRSKVIMPEYVVGQKPKKKEKKVVRELQMEKCKQLKLNHLEELEEDEF